MKIHFKDVIDFKMTKGRSFSNYEIYIPNWLINVRKYDFIDSSWETGGLLTRIYRDAYH